MFRQVGAMLLLTVCLQVAAATENVDRLVVKKSERKMLVLKDGKVVREMDVALGLMPKGHKAREGDFRTPEGEYRLGRRNPYSRFFLSPDHINSLIGLHYILTFHSLYLQQRRGCCQDGSTVS